MSLENFNLNFSQEACHFFAGTTVGGLLLVRYLFYVAIFYLVIYIFIKLISPSLSLLGENIKKNIMRKRK